MPSDEIFLNPLVKQVLFEIQFPNMFFLESHIGEFQMKVMERFPKSELLLQRHFILTSTDEKKREQLASELPENEPVTKIWQFESDQGVKLNVTSKSLALVSDSHKSYRLGDEPFRKLIDSVCNHFLSLTELPILKRIGLRYIDECPVPENNSTQFREYYNTVFPLKRFPLEDAVAMDYKVVVKRENHMLRYVESIQNKGQERKLVLDFDAWSQDVEPDNMLTVVDELHDIIWTEFRNTIKEPVLEHMRKPLEAKDVR